MQSKGITRCHWLSGAAACALLAVIPAMAQNSVPAGAGETGLETVVVTAERRAENQQNVPVSVGVLSGDSLSRITSSGDDTLLALSGKVPGLYVESTTGRIFPRFYIRGLGNVDFYLGASQPVSIIQDDIVLEHVVLKSNPVYDVDQIEVLRGPQGSLFGRNTTAGIIKFATNRPTEDFEGRASASYGAYNSIDLDAGIGGPIISDKLAFRISGLYQHRDDYIDNTYTGVSADGTKTGQKDALGGFDERDLRLQFLLTPSADFSVLTSVHGRWYDGTSTVFRRGGITLGSHDVSNQDWDKTRYDEADNNPQSYNTYGGSVNASWKLGDVTLTSITGYESTSGFSRGDTDGGAAADYGNTGYGESMGRVRALGQWTEEMRLSSADDARLKWQVGGLYFDSRDKTEFYQRAWFLTGTAHNPNNWVRLHDVNTSWSLFGQASYQLTDAFTITGGARVTEDSKETRLLKTADKIDGTVTYTGRRDVKMSDTRPSWDVSALYTINPDVNVYVRVAKGFRGPTIQGRSAVFNSDFTTAKSETILSWEAGLKSQLSNTLRFNASVFTYTVDNIQLNGNDSNGNGVLFNARHANAYGMETELDWLPIDNLSLTAGLSLLHTRIKDNRVYAQTCSFNGAMTCTVGDSYFTKGSGTGKTYYANINGNPLPNAPEYNLNFAARYDIPLDNSGKLFVSTDWNMQGYTNYVLYQTKEFSSNGNFEGGLRVGYTHADGAWEIAAYVRNITDEKNLKGVIENYRASVLNDPRIIGVSLTANLH